MNEKHEYWIILPYSSKKRAIEISNEIASIDEKYANIVVERPPDAWMHEKVVNMEI